MAELDFGPPGEDENVSGKLPATDIEAAALRPAIAELLRTISTTWVEYDSDSLTKLQSHALFLLTAAGMVERRGWFRSTIANHPTCFEVRFQATGEAGFLKAMEQANIIEYQSWKEAWEQWRASDTKNHSPFHAQEMKPQEWRLTEQGEIAHNDLKRASPDSDPSAVFDYVLKRGFVGPGYWMRQLALGRRLSEDEQRIVRDLEAAGRDLEAQPRQPYSGSGRLLEIRKIVQTSGSQAVKLTNWGEGASAFADAFGKTLGPMFEAMQKAASVAYEKTDRKDPQNTDYASPESAAIQAAAPTSFNGGQMVFLQDRVMLCGVDICSGPRSKSRRIVLELLGRKLPEGLFVAYSGEDLEAKATERGASGTAGRWIQDLRCAITETLLNDANIAAGHNDIILSSGPGYRFAECISVQFGSSSPITDITDMDATPDVRDGDVRDVQDESEKRRTWILDQLANGVLLKAPHVASQFNRSTKTAQRDLEALREEGKIEFTGDPRTGHYRLRRPPGE